MISILQVSMKPASDNAEEIAKECPIKKKELQDEFAQHAMRTHQILEKEIKTDSKTMKIGEITLNHYCMTFYNYEEMSRP